jgi:ABC-type branched-subunit amino acid transport system ATPase component
VVGDPPTAGGSAALVELRGITKRFPGGTLANDAIDLELRQGEILALLGENGAGKSTLMSILTACIGRTTERSGCADRRCGSARRTTPSAMVSAWCIRTSCWCRRSPSPRT